MALELRLDFSDRNELTLTFDGQNSEPVTFQNPLTEAELGEVRWYLEVYGAQYTADVDDERADRLAVNLKRYGTRLFEAAFEERSAIRLFDQFLDEDEPGRLITISAVTPEILALPWELLRQPGGAYIFNEKPRISVRRNLSQLKLGRRPKRFKPKEKLRLLMVVSRPSDAGFIDPRSEPQAVLDAIDRYGAERVEVEFLRPATLAGLTARLEREDLPGVDILHFDGHGVFDASGALTKNDAVSQSELEKLKGEGKNMGYLLFEAADGKKDLVSAERLGELLNQQGLGMVVLSACQSSMVARKETASTDGGEGADVEEDDAGVVGSVAARLTQTGVPSVLAMSYSVLVTTAQQLFGKFYENLVTGKGIGESLDNARRSLLSNPERGERSRGQERIMLRLEDWFVPTLYQSGSDRGMVLATETGPSASAGGEGQADDKSLPPDPIAGFFGRRKELWDIERAFTPKPRAPQQETRRLTICGFGGQGKTALATEAGRWLVRSGLFEAAVFVDYAAFQGVDAVGVAVSTLARDLETNLIDADAVTVALGQRRVLVILDNLEDLSAEAQQGLLTQAVDWSAAGQSRVLITTRQDDLGHGGYGRSGYAHQQISLAGLGQEDAIDYFQALMALPPVPARLPQRKNLIELFAKVDFHPLSIALVAEQLRVRSIVDVELALDRLLAEVPAGQKKDQSLIASLNLSLDRLDGASRQLVGRLGVFQGGAMEPDLLAITEFTPEQWQPLRRQLAAAGLLRAESLEAVGVGGPFLKFHPTLARVLWAGLDDAAQAELAQRHRQRYYALSRWLCIEDTRNPHAARAIARRELPNLLVAVRGALVTREDWAMEFVTNVNLFLGFFGMNGDLADLTDQAEKAGQSAAVGSQAWYLAQMHSGEQLRGTGQPQAAKVIFEEILAGLGDAVSFNHSQTLISLGRCWRAMGQSAQAATLYRQALDELEWLEPSDDVQRKMSIAQGDLGNVLMDVGDYEAARQAYGLSLAIAQKIGREEREIAVVNIQLGTLALHEGNLTEAETRYQSALTTFHKLDEPETKAIVWHQLGNVYKGSQAWESAEQAYRASAQLKEAQGKIGGGSNGAAATWSQLAIVCAISGKQKEAEAWGRKALKVFKAERDNFATALALSNLANLQQTQDNLPEAQHLAEEALALKQTLDPGTTEIWKTYGLLAQIATQQGEAAQAQAYRRQARQSYAAFAGSKQLLQQQEGFIQGIVAATQDEDIRQQLEAALSQLPAEFATAIRQLLAGEQDEALLCDPLRCDHALLFSEVLRRL